MSLKTAQSVYAYSDFRVYLRDCYAERKEQEPSYSYRALARDLGFSSPNYPKLILDGKRNIGIRSLKRILKGLALRDRESEYFCYLVFFCQAKDPVQKNYYFGLLTKFKTPTTAEKISTKEYEYYNNWYNCIIRELVTREKAPVDYKQLARKVQPAITESQARKSVELLQGLGLIQKQADGSYCLKSRLIATDREVTSMGIRAWHKKMIDLSKEAIDHADKKDREISSLTICISDVCKKKIKKRIQDFEDELLQMVRDDVGTDNVYQLNFQLFPVSRKGGRP